MRREPIDLTSVETPTYVQAAEDHIPPWKVMNQRGQALRSGRHMGWSIPPAAGKTSILINDSRGHPATFVDGATEHMGSWWPDWIEWLAGSKTVKADGARVPGEGKPGD